MKEFHCILQTKGVGVGKSRRLIKSHRRRRRESHLLQDATMKITLQRGAT